MDQADDEFIRKLTGFQRPVRVGNQMRNFLAESGNNRKAPLDVDLAVKDEVSSRNILLHLLTIYVKDNNLESKGLVSPSPLMRKYFDTTEPFKYNKLVGIIAQNVFNLDDQTYNKRLVTADKEVSEVSKRLREQRVGTVPAGGAIPTMAELPPVPASPTTLRK